MIRRRCVLDHAKRYCIRCNGPADWKLNLPRGGVLYVCEADKASAEKQLWQLRRDLETKAHKLPADTWNYLKSLSLCKLERL